MPRTRSELLDLHGVGEYTARSVLIHTGREGISAVDSNVERLLSRFFGFDPADRDVQSTVDQLAPPKRSSDFLGGMLDFAAEVCTPRSPRCSDCPLKPDCASAHDFADGGASE